MESCADASASVVGRFLGCAGFQSVMGLMVVGWLVGACVAAEPMSLPFEDSFSTGSLASEWKISAAKGNSITAEKGQMKIEAAANTHANIQRPLGVDMIRATCILTSGGGLTWSNTVALYWNERNWCKVGIIPHQKVIYTAQSIDDAYVENTIPVPEVAENWQYVAVELGENCVRYQYSVDGKTWLTARLSIRTEDWKGPPRLLIVGKSFTAVGDDHVKAAPDLNNDFSDPGAPTVSYVRNVSVSKTPSERLVATEAEFDQYRAGRDRWTEAELAAPADPSFESVCRHFPAMQFSREVVGLKDGPQEMVVQPSGMLQVDTANYEEQHRGHWDVTSLYFEIGEPAKQLSGGADHWDKRLWNGYLPIVVASHSQEGLAFEQTAFGWSPDMSADAPGIGYVRLKVSNPGNESRRLALQLQARREKDQTIRKAAGWDVEIAAGGSECVWIKTPFPNPDEVVKVDASEFDGRLDEVAAWWQKQLSKGTRISVPDQRINDAYRAWLAYNFINVDKHGAYCEPHDGGGFYEAVFGYSAAKYCNALDWMGYHEDAERYLDSLIPYITPEGVLNINFGIMDSGTLMEVMGEHYRLTKNDAWLRRIVPSILKMSNWILEQRRKIKSDHPKDSQLYGLIKGAPYCDHQAPVYSYLTDCSFVAGMDSVSDALASIGMQADAERIRVESKAYREDILRSMARSPVQDGTMRILPMFPETHELIKTTNYSAKDYYALVAGMLLETGVLESSGEPARLIVDFMERRGGLLLGMCSFSGGVDHAYTFGYWKNCLTRDEIRRVLVGFYGALAYGMTRNTYAAVECTSITDGANYPTLPDTYSNTQQLRLLRMMLIEEQQDKLVLCQAVPRPWLEDGKQIRVEEAPTRFGNVNFAINSQVEQGRIVATIDPPVREMPKAIVLRLRHPTQKPIVGVQIDGVPSKEFGDDTVTLQGIEKPVTVEVRY